MVNFSGSTSFSRRKINWIERQFCIDISGSFTAIICVVLGQLNRLAEESVTNDPSGFLSQYKTYKQPLRDHLVCKQQ